MITPATQCCDCAIVGAGPGGYAAAIYLARFNRQALLFGAGRPRVSWSPLNRNYPGFPEGITGDDLLARFEAQAAEFGIQRIPERVTCIRPYNSIFQVQSGSVSVEARTVILATGISDIWPNVPRVDECKGRLIRVCPICDAYETNGKRVGLIGCGDKVAREALYLRCFTSDLTLFTNGMDQDRPICQQLSHRLGAEGIKVCSQPLKHLDPLDDEGVLVRLEDGSEVEVELLFSALGVQVHNELAVMLGVHLDKDGYIFTDRWQQTSVPGVYAVGDVTFEINQVSVAVGQAAIAATAVHNSLLDF